jgi:glycine dehydrogenase
VCACPPPEAFAEHDFAAHEPAANGAVPGRDQGAPDDLGTTADVVGASA